MPPAERPTGLLRIMLGVLKTVAILGGLPLSLLALMALVGLATDNGWARLIVALVVAIGLPLFIVDRLLPDDNVTTARGVPTDTLALIWAGFALAFFGAGHVVTAKATAREADRLAAGSYHRLAKVGYYLAAVRPTAPEPLAKKATPSSQPQAKKNAAKKVEPKKVVEAAKDEKKTDEKKTADTKKAADAKKVDKKKAGTKKTTYTPQELFANFSPAVVTIRGVSSSGTGFVIDDIGTIATNHHVIAKQARLQVKLKKGVWIRDVEILAHDKKRDLALLRIKSDKKLTVATLGDSNAIKVGERVIAIGNPLGLDHTLTDGVVSSRRILRQQKWIQTSTPVSPGNSGGPLFNMNGEVVGVITAQYGHVFTRAQNLNLAVPINDLKKMIKDDYPNRRAAGADAPQTW